MIQVADVQAAQATPPEWVRDELGGATGNGIRVAVLDSGWDRSIDEPRVLPGVGFVDPDDDFALGRNDDDQDVLGHGTACADVILGVAPDARIIPVKVFGKKLETSPGTLQTALEWAIEAGVQVINVSLGTQLTGTLRPLYIACERARQAGIIVVAAGPNASDWSYPAIFENVIGVSAARFTSPYHFHYVEEEAMECIGWGVDRPVLWVGGERVVRHGTSFAAPGVAGIVALILERHPGAKIEDVRAMLARFALPGSEAARPVAPPKGRKRATPPAETAPARAGTRRRKRTAADDAAPAKSASKSRKRAAAPALDSASTTPAKTATKSRARTAPAKTADVAAPTKSRKRPAAPASDAAPARSSSKSRKRTAAPASDSAPARSASKSRKQAAVPEKSPVSATPAKAATKSRKRVAAPVEGAPVVADSKRKRAASPARASDTPARARVATKSRKQAAAPAKAADSAAPARAAKQPRKRAAAADDAAAQPAAKPRKRPATRRRG